MTGGPDSGTGAPVEGHIVLPRPADVLAHREPFLLVTEVVALRSEEHTSELQSL